MCRNFLASGRTQERFAVNIAYRHNPADSNRDRYRRISGSPGGSSRFVCSAYEARDVSPKSSRRSRNHPDLPQARARLG
jgi:hypothetical protein